MYNFAPLGGMMPRPVHSFGMKPMKARLSRAALTVLLAAFMLAGCGGDEPASGAGGDSADRNRVVFIGIDGAEWDVMRPLMARGELPHLKALMERGASGHLVNPGPQVSPVVWTTFATGHFGRAHGILDFAHPFDDSDQKRPVRSTLRQVPAIWNVATAEGRSAGVVGYFVSHPAEEINGFVVSDRAPARVDGAVHPEDLLSGTGTRPEEAFTESTKAALFDRFFPWGYDPAHAEDPENPYHEVTRTVAGRVDNRILSDEYLRRASLALAGRDVDLFVTYLRLVDVASHAAWRYYDAGDFEDKPDPEDRERLGGLVPETYRYADEFVGRLVEIIGEDANYVIVSDHGFGSATGAFAPKHDERILTGNHRPNGILIAAGPDIRPGEYREFSIMEIMPALAALLGLPISDELPGRLPRELLTDEILERQPPRFVARYDDHWRPAAGGESADAGADRQEMESLKGLGYIGGDVEVAEPGVGSDYDFWSASEQLIVTHLSGEAFYFLLQGDLEAARGVVQQAESNGAAVGREIAARVGNKRDTLNRQLPEPLDHAETFDAFISWAQDR